MLKASNMMLKNARDAKKYIGDIGVEKTFHF
jgi:hypothetical protein